MSGRRLSRGWAGVCLLVLVDNAGASHNWFGVDLCRRDPARMPPVLAVDDLPEPQSRGARLLADYCAQCHNLPHPGVHTAEEWRVVTATMQRLAEVTARFDGRPGLRLPDAAEHAAIDAYLAERALRPLPAGEVAPDVYHALCGDCHAAPDPALYSARAWPAVFARMAGHRAAMAREPLDPLVATRVLAYLSEHAAPDGSGGDGGATGEPTTGRWLALAPVLALGLFALWRLLGHCARRLPWRPGARRAT